MRRSLQCLVLVPSIVISVIIYRSINEHDVRPFQSRDCDPTHLVAFIKIHKVGGTTVQNVIQRYGENHRLLAAIPRTRNIFGKELKNIVKIPKGLSFDLLFSHMSYFNRSSLDNIMPKRTVYFSIVREPLSQLVSSFYYYKYTWHLTYLDRIPKDENPFFEYLLHVDKYEPSDVVTSFTNNRMSYDLGLPESDFLNKSAIENWLRQLDTSLDFILITEHFNESLVILKRRFCWTLKDILYVSRNVNPRKPNLQLSSEMLHLYRKRYLADIMLYNYSYSRFQDNLRQQASDFQDEVLVFEDILNQVAKYCSSAYMPKVLLLPSLTVKKNRFSPDFEITPWDCEMMYLTEIEFIRRTRKKQDNLIFMQQLNIPG